MDRRARFFFVAALACAVLLWPCPEELRWVGLTLVVAFGVLGLLSLADDLVRKRQG